MGGKIIVAGNSGSKPKSADWHAKTQEIISRLDLREEFAALGVEFTADTPNAEGWLTCRCWGKQDENPSAGANVAGKPPQLGRYKEFTTGKNCSLFDLAAEAGVASDFRGAVRHYAKQTKVDLPDAPRAADKELDWRGWSSPIARLWCHYKGGVITEEAVVLCGGRLAGYPKKTGEHQVLAFPAFGWNLLSDEPCNYVMAATNGHPIPIFRGEGKPKEPVKYPTQAKCSPGWCGRFGLANLADAELVWKVEGIPDMLAVQSIIPKDLREKHVVVTNSNGSGQVFRPAAYYRSFVGKRVFVCHDADTPGEHGAAMYAAEFAQAGAEAVRVRLPYEIAEKHGKDVRDWLIEWGAAHGVDREAGRDWTDELRVEAYRELMAMAEAQAAVSPAVASAAASFVEGRNGHAAANGQPAAAAVTTSLDILHEQREICGKLQIEVLGEWPDGHVEVYSLHLKKTRRVKDTDRLGYNQLAQICGPVVKKHIHHGSQDIPDMLRLSQVREAVALLGGQNVLSEGSIKGRGVWRGTNEIGAATNEVVLVGAGEAVLWDGEKLELLARPRSGQMVLQLSGHSPWFEREAFKALMEQSASPAWCESVVEECIQLFRGWRWRDAVSPEIVTGLVLATWVQSMWTWRPQVVVTGRTNSGKTYLFKTLHGLFGGLAMSARGDSTEAGIRQEIGHGSPVVLLDEWDTSKSQQRVLDLIRSSSRGDQRLTGTTHQKSVHAGVQQMFWLAGIVSGLRKAADLNRFICLELVSPADDQRTLVLRPDAELAELGQRLLAVAVRHAMCAVPLADRLRQHHVMGVDPRLVESFAVPAAMLGCVGELDQAKTENLLRQLLAAAHEVGDKQSDEMDLLQTILGAVIDAGKKLERCTISHLFSEDMSEMDGAKEARKALGNVGLSVQCYTEADAKKHGIPLEKVGRKCLAIHHQSVSRYLLRGTDWEHRTIREVLGRIPGTFSDDKRVGKSTKYSQVVDWEIIERLISGSDPLDVSDLL